MVAASGQRLHVAIGICEHGGDVGRERIGSTLVSRVVESRFAAVSCRFQPADVDWLLYLLFDRLSSNNLVRIAFEHLVPRLSLDSCRTAVRRLGEDKAAMSELQLGPGPPGTRTWNEIGQSEGKGRSSHKSLRGREVCFSI